MSVIEAQSPAALDFARLSLPPGYRLVVVGSHGGIGTALCEAALGLGARVAGLDTPRAISERPGRDGLIEVPIDVGDPVSIDQAFDAVATSLGAIDGLAFVAGIGERPTLAVDHSVEQWDRAMDVNLRGAFLSAVRARALMTAATGSVVFISSSLAASVEPGFSAYAASKAGMLAVVKGLAKEWAPGVRVNAISPGLIDTAFLGGGTGHGAAASGHADAWFGASRARQIIESAPLKRIGVPDDIVAPMLFLLGEGARFMTGQNLFVNGGRYMP